MTTTDPSRPARASGPPDPSSDARRDARPATSAYPTFAEILGETLPLVGVVAVAGPPVVLLAGPLVLFALILLGPFLLVLTLVALLIASTLLVALAGAIIASPYLLVRHLGERRAGAPSSLGAPASWLVPAGSRRIPTPVRSAARAIREG